MGAPEPQQGRLGDLIAPLRADPRASAILADVDGTLAPIVDRPEAAGVPEEARDSLRSLARRYALVACVSGRRAADARAVVGLEELLYIGNHGFERLAPGAEAPTAAPAIREHADAAASFVEHHLDPAVLEAAGLRPEDKGAIRALHWRGAPDEAVAEARAREIATEAIGFKLVPHWGRKVLELRPPVGLDKGTAVAELVEEQELSRALYGGDDRTDVDAFRRLRDMLRTGDLETAVCVGVASDEGPRELGSESDAVVEGTAGFAAILRLLAK